MANIRKLVISTTAITIYREAFVKEASYPKISIGMSRLISNCAMGL
jgi:hypothetical protein